jgi:hypothetical protein
VPKNALIRVGFKNGDEVQIWSCQKKAVPLHPLSLKTGVGKAIKIEQNDATDTTTMGSVSDHLG